MEASQIQHGDPRRLVMSAPTPLRQDFDASQLRGLARKTKDGPQARRLLALAAIYDGATRTEAAKIGGVGLQIIRDWVLRFNARGPDGLLDGKSTGQPSKLNATQRHAMHRRDRATLDHAGDGLPLSVVELGRLSCRLAIQETVRTAGVEAQRPVPDDLKSKTADA